MNRKQKKVLIRIIVSALLLALSFLPLYAPLKIIFSLSCYLLVGFDVLYKAVRNLLHAQLFDECFLMAIATVGALLLGELVEASAVMLFYQTGELLQNIAVGKSRKSVASLMDICPDTARVMREGKSYEVSPDEVEIGETILVYAGEKIPIDSVITSGSGSIDSSALTGESLPLFKESGDSVMSGCINLTGVLELKTLCLYQNSSVSRILELVENAADKKAKSEKFITRFARYYTPCVVIAALILAFVPPIFVGDLMLHIKRALTFLVVSCPCALVISVPLSFFSAIGAGAKKGVLFKGSSELEALSKINTFVFDKTGTLTTGNFTVSKIESSVLSKSELISIAASLEQFSSHPIAQAIANAAEHPIPKDGVTSTEEIAGMGMSARLGGIMHYVGNARLMQENTISIPDKTADSSAVFVAREGEYLGKIYLSDTIKKNAAEAVAALYQNNITKTVMLTGDQYAPAREVCRMLNISEFFAQLVPQQKVEAVEKLISDGRKVAFVGDGINDAPVLMRSDISFAMGNFGSDAAIEAADIVIVDDNLLKIPMSIRLSRKTMKIVYQNIIFSIFVKLSVLLLAALGFANMWVAIFSDVGVMLLAVLNSLRCLKIKY